jgi:opacity protein-like surface antigen
MRSYSLIGKYLSIFTLGALVLGVGLVMPAQADWRDNHTTTQWGGTLRVGGAFFSDGDAPDSSNPAPMLNGQIFYNLAGPRGELLSDWLLGISADYEHHELDDTKAEIDVVTVMPFAEFRTRYDHWAPYFKMGYGINFSSVKNEPSGVDVDVKNSFAMKFGVGADWFITDHIAINTEVAWKYNHPDVKGKVAGTTVSAGNAKLSVAQVMAGLRVYFGE